MVAANEPECNFITAPATQTDVWNDHFTYDDETHFEYLFWFQRRGGNRQNTIGTLEAERYVNIKTIEWFTVEAADKMSQWNETCSQKMRTRNGVTKADGIDFFRFSHCVLLHRREQFSVEFWVRVEMNLFIASTWRAEGREQRRYAQRRRCILIFHSIGRPQIAPCDGMFLFQFRFRVLLHPSRHSQSMKCYSFVRFWRQWRHSFRLFYFMDF